MKKAVIIGTGGIAHKHVEAIRDAGEALELVAAVDIDAVRVQEFCKTHNIPAWYTSTAEMLSEQQPQLASICTPPSLHKQQVIECLEAGAWVLCEKPISASLAELDEIIAVEERTGCYAASVFQIRYGAGAQHLKQLINAGALGRSLVGICQTTWYRSQAYYDVPWRGKWATETGGTTMIHGIHEIDMMLWLLGDWREVRAMMGTLDRNIEVDDVMMGIVQLENNAMVSIINSALSPREETYLRLDFQKATVEVLHLYGYNNTNWKYTLPGDSEDKDRLAEWQTIPDETPPSQTSQLKAFLAAMSRGERPPVSGEDVRRTMEFLTALYKAAITGQPVQRGSITPDDPFYHAMNGRALVAEG